jgi:zinc and cadmium transporter
MSAIALIGGVFLFFREGWLERLILPLVALAAGSLIGGALFHLLPAALSSNALSQARVFGGTALGFAAFLALEQFIHHHHCHRPLSDCKKPLGTLILMGDGLHNLLGGVAVASTFVIDVKLGIATWLAAAAHEVPQELGDFATLVHAGWTKRRALLVNFISALFFPLGGLCAYALSFHWRTDWLIAFAAGNFLYIGASDLVPEVNKHRSARTNIIHFSAFAAGLAILWWAGVNHTH